MSKIVVDYNGFLKFICRANERLISWFGPHCEYDASRISFMAAREWEAMSDIEKKHFIRANKVDSKQDRDRPPSGSHPFLCYLLHKRHSSFPGSNLTNNGIVKQSLFHPDLGRANSLDWKAMPKLERDKFANMKLTELSIDHLIEKRDKLHEIYEPRELSILEFILRTQPKKPHNPRTWFITMENLSINCPEVRDRWYNLSNEDRRFYEECARLDKKRFLFETNAWKTKLLSTDFERDDLSLADFESIQSVSNVETIGNLIQMNKKLIPNNRPKGPLSPFSLFVRDFRYQTREERPQFKFGQHLKNTSKAWNKLTEEEKQFYKDISQEMRKSFAEAKKSRTSTNNKSEQEVCHLLFKHEKSVTGPSRPSHLTIRVPNVVDIFGKAKNIKKSERKKSWAALTDDEKQPFFDEHETLIARSKKERDRIKSKLEYIGELIKKSEELVEVKKQLHLLRKRNREPKNLYS